MQMRRRWTLGRLKNVWGALLLACFGSFVQAQTQWPAQYTITRSSSFEYDSASGLLTRETVEPGSPQECVQTTYAYDNWGNRTTTTVSNCAGAAGDATFVSRSSTTQYSGDSTLLAGAAAGTFPIVVRNALNHEERRRYNPKFGEVDQLTGPNGLTTRWEFDAFGRKVTEIRHDGTRTRMWYCYIGPGLDTSSNTEAEHTAAGLPGCAALNSGAYAVLSSSLSHSSVAYFVHTQEYDSNNATSAPFKRTYFDPRGREVRTVAQAFDGAGSPTGGRYVVQDKAYNQNGAVAATTAPYFLNPSNPSQRSATLASVADYDAALGANKPASLNPTVAGGSYTEYDILGRPTKVYAVDTASAYDSRSTILGGSGAASTVPSGAPLGLAGLRATTVTYRYDSMTAASGIATEVVDDLGRVQRQEKNAQGKVVRTTDAMGAQMAFVYDAHDNLVKTIDPLGNVVRIGYDRKGQKRLLHDPNKGVWTYDYNALGELVRQTDAKGQAVRIAYDVLGRVTEREDLSGLESRYRSRYFYDTVNGTSVGAKCSDSAVVSTKGLLCGSQEMVRGARRSINYDAWLRPTRETQDVVGESSAPAFTTSMSYNAAGKLDVLTYPTGLQVQYQYTTGLGFLERVRNHTAGTVLWTANQSNAAGQIERATFGNGTQNRSLFDPQNPARTLYSGARINGQAADAVFKHTYRWDSVNNLLNRYDENGNGNAQAVTEAFHYDALNRLTRYDVASPGIIATNFQRTVQIQYNVVGNILYKSDVGAYSYPAAGSARPHAVQSVTGSQHTATYQYDANGNLTQATGSAKYRNITYTSFNMPDEGATGGLTGASGNLRYRWWYDMDQKRIKEVRSDAGGTRTTWYVHPNNAGGLAFEREQASSGQITNRHYVSAGGVTFAVLTSNETGGATVVNSTVARTIVRAEYWHRDHLGSIAATSDANQQIRRYAYDPFGKRRYPDGNFDAGGAIVADYPNGTDRGFTGHEHLDDVGIVHMNGRLFDPLLARFMQPDPFVQEPYLLQNYNAYSYTLNNPLNATDPDGRWFWYVVAAISAARATGIIDQKTFRTLMSIVVSVYLGPYGYYGANGIAGNALLSTAVSGFASGAISTGNLQGGIQGMFSSVLFYGAGQMGTSMGFATTGFSAGRVALHAAAGCVSASVAGGKCSQGAMSAGLTKAMGSAIPDASGANARELNTIKYSLIGGTMSVVGGGKFSNGAVTGAFQYLFNQVMSKAAAEAAAAARNRAVLGGACVAGFENRCAGITAGTPEDRAKAAALTTSLAAVANATDTAAQVVGVGCLTIANPCVVPAAVTSAGAKVVSIIFAPTGPNEMALGATSDFFQAAMEPLTRISPPTFYFGTAALIITTEAVKPSAKAADQKLSR